MLSNKVINFLTKSRNALAICVLFNLIIALRIFTASPFPGGVDVATHLFQISLIASEGFTHWNHWWYAGHPLLDQYPPLSHAVGAFFSAFIGVENAYKLTTLMAFLAIPISFFLLLQEFKFRDEQKAFAVYFFSLSPIFAYSLQGGVFSALFALPLAILFFKYTIRTSNEKKWVRPAMLSAVFLALASLSHLFMPIAAAAFAFLYIMVFSRNVASFLRFAAVILFSCLLSAFFWAPLVLNYHITTTPQYSVASSLPQLVFLGLAPVAKAFAVYINFISLFLVGTVILLMAFTILSDYRNKNLDYSIFLLLCILTVIVWVLFLPGGDSGSSKLPLFLPMFFAIFICRGFGTSRFTTSLSVLVILAIPVLSLLIETTPISPEIYDFTEWAGNKTEMRALFLPQGFGLLEPFEDDANSPVFLYDVYLLPHYSHKEVYNGWFAEAMPRSGVKQVGFSCARKRSFSEILSEISFSGKLILGKLETSCTPDGTPEDLCAMLREGAVDSVFINSNFPSVVSFADNASCLLRSDAYGPLVYYKVDGAQPYIDGNFNYTKKSGTITIQVEGPFEGNLTVRESYYPYWKAYLDSVEIPIGRSEYGFLGMPLNVSGVTSELKLIYSPNDFYGIFTLVSLLSGLAVLAASIHRPSAYF